MDIKYIIKGHPLALPREVAKVEKLAKAFASNLQKEGRIHEAVVQNTWKSDGKFGGEFLHLHITYLRFINLFRKKHPLAKYDTGASIAS